MMWPTVGGTPINEFTTEGYFHWWRKGRLENRLPSSSAGYFSLVFPPTLFPTGAAEFLGQHHNPVTIGYYFKQLKMCDDGCFAN